MSLLEGRQSVVLYSKNGTQPTLKHELDISSPNFIALGASFFVVKLRYSVKDNLTVHAGDYKNWECLTLPAFSWFKNIRVEMDGTEVTHSSSVGHANFPAHHESHGRQHR